MLATPPVTGLFKHVLMDFTMNNSAKLLGLLFAAGGATGATLPSGAWIPLGGNLNTTPASLASKPSLAGDPRAEPLVSFSVNYTEASGDNLTITNVLRWSPVGWKALGNPIPAPYPSLAAPSLAIDPDRGIYLCTGGGGPYAWRWTGAQWLALGGDIAAETGYSGSRYSVDSCGGIVAGRKGTPLVSWSADVGAKANAVYAARWDRASAAWIGFGPDAIGGRATDTVIDIDRNQQPYVATWTPGGSYGGGRTTRVWHWDAASDAWVQFGVDLPETDAPTLAVYENTPYLALGDAVSGTLSVMRWRAGAWERLPDVGNGSGAAIDFSLSGRPLVAYLSSDEGAPTIRLKYLSHGAWLDVGDAVAELSPEGSPQLDLSVDGMGRPVIAWSDVDPTLDNTAIYAKRFSKPLP